MKKAVKAHLFYLSNTEIPRNARNKFNWLMLVLDLYCDASDVSFEQALSIINECIQTNVNTTEQVKAVFNRMTA